MRITKGKGSRRSLVLLPVFAISLLFVIFAVKQANRQEIVIKISNERMEEYVLTELQKLEHVQFNQSMMLINTDYMLPEDFTAEIAEYRDTGVNMNSCITMAYGTLSDAVKAATGDTLFISSGIRDRKQQQRLYEEQPETATIPGASEHETGLSMDVYVAYYAGDGFLKSEAGRFVNDYCDEYGFIIRYPSYGEKETSIPFEPWHIRYVGFPHSEIIYNNRLTLEEYIFSLEEGVCYEADGYLITRQRPKNGRVQVPVECKEYVVSSDNTGCYIITGKRPVETD